MSAVLARWGKGLRGCIHGGRYDMSGKMGYSHSFQGKEDAADDEVIGEGFGRNTEEDVG